jgi:hypothetical protein
VSGDEKPVWPSAERTALTKEAARAALKAARASFDEHLAESRRLAETPLTRDEILSLGDRELFDHVWMRVSSRITYFDAAALRREDPDVAAFIATEVFEGEVMNGGLSQYFYNAPDPDHLRVVLDGYTRLGLAEVRELIAEIVAPLTDHEAAWRASLQAGTVESFFDSHPEAFELDELIELHDAERLRVVRAVPDKFAG